MNRKTNTPTDETPKSDRQSATPVPGKRIKVHSSYVWAQALYVAFICALVVLGTFLSMGDSPKAHITFTVTALGCLAIVLLVVVLQILAYKYLWYQFDEREFSLYSGIFVKKKTHVPYTRIQSVNHRAGIFQRIIGVCSVALDTAGGADNKAIVIPFVTNAAAEQIRAELFARKRAILNQEDERQAVEAAAAGQPPRTRAAAENILDETVGDVGTFRGAFGGQRLTEEQASYEAGLTNKELLLTGISNSALTALIVCIAICCVLGIVAWLYLGPLVQDALNALAASGPTLNIRSLDQTGMRPMGLVLMVFLPLITIMAASWLIGLIVDLISFGGFKVRRRGSRIEVERGLLQREFSGIDIDRIQSIVVKQSPIRRLMGYCELSLGRVDSTTKSDANDQNAAKLNTSGLVVHPFVKLTEVNDLLAGLLPEFADTPTSITPLPRVAHRRAIGRRCVLRGGAFWCFIALTACYLIGQITLGTPDTIAVIGAAGTNAISAIMQTLYAVGAVSCGLLFIFKIVDAVLWARESGFAYNRQFTQIRNGGFSQQTISVPRSKIQFGYTKRNPLQTMAHVSTVALVTASGIGGTKTVLWDVNEEQSDAWLDWLKPRHGSTI